MPEDDDGDGLFPVQVSGGAKILLRVDNLRDVRQMHCSSVVVADDERLVLIRVGDLIVRDDVQRLVIIFDLSPRLMGVLKTEDRLNVAEREP